MVITSELLPLVLSIHQHINRERWLFWFADVVGAAQTKIVSNSILLNAHRFVVLKLTGVVGFPISANNLHNKLDCAASGKGYFLLP